MHRAQLLSIAVVIILFPAISHAADPNTLTDSNPPAAQPTLDYRTIIINALSQETLLESFENLANYDDVVPTTAMFSGGESYSPLDYEYNRLLVSRLNRMRKVYAEAKDNPQQLVPLLIDKLSESADNFEKIAYDLQYEIAHKGSVATYEPDEYEKRTTYAPAAAYLLAEFHAYEALPLMHKVFTTEGRSPVNRIFLFYSMHLLAKDYPTDNLSLEARQALDAYLAATKDIPEPEIINVPVWNAAYDDSDFRQAILRRDMTKNQPKIPMRVYPSSMVKYEIVDWDAGSKHMYQVKPEVKTYVNLLADFISKTTSPFQEKGFPVMSAPRKAAYKQTRFQSIPEVIADLGNFWTISFTRNHNIGASYAEIAGYRNDIMSNLKVLRLIEEGRKDSTAIKPLLEQEISKCLSNYDSVNAAYRRLFDNRTLPTVSISEVDPYYSENKQYGSPIFERNRIQFVVYASFYIIANIAELDNPQLISSWMQKRVCPEMDVWLIENYYKTVNDNLSSKQKYLELTKNIQLTLPDIKVSRWNASWDIHDMLIQAANVDTSDIQTIQILQIPAWPDIDDSRIDEIEYNFMEYVETLNN